MADPKIRRFAIEELMQAHSKSYPGRLSKAQYEMLAAFRHQVCQYVHFSEFVAQVAGLTPRQYQALLAIKGFPSLFGGELRLKFAQGFGKRRASHPITLPLGVC